MTLGRSAPRYQMMALVYPRSKNLQSHLSEYFIVVVRLCHQLLKFTQKSTLGQLASSLSDSDMKAYQSELDFWANSIKEEVGLLMGQKIEEEAQENFRFRALSSKFSESMSHRKKLKTNLRVLHFCSTYDYETTWKQTRKTGNATLFNRTPEYKDWKDRPDSCTLVYTGKLGSGKSVLLANVVDDINLHIQSENIAVAYFFCRHDIPESLKAQTVIGSLARQLLRPIPDLTIVAEFLDETTSALDFERIFSLLQRALPSNCKAYFILDGLDECDHVERQALIQHLRKLQETFTLLLCVSFRLEADNSLRLSSEQFITPSIISIPDDNPDIELFIAMELKSCIQSRKLAIGNPTLIREIQDALLEGAQGMFLWVALQIESLCAEKTDESIRKALSDLPKDLSETFSRILRRSKKSGKSYQRRILELVTVAHRPLTMEEIREALSVVPGDAVWNPARLLNDVYSVLTCCGSLITVDEEELTIRLVHHSVKQFLLSGFKDLADITFTIDSANRKMADIIVTYLSYGIFETQLSTMVVPQIMTGAAPSRIIRSTIDSSSNVRSLALKLLESRKQPNYDISKTLAEARKHFESSSVDEFHFYSYAKSYWLHHNWDISDQDPVMYNLLLKLFKGKAVDIGAMDEDGRTPLLWAAMKGHEAVVELLLDSGKVDANTNARDKDGRTPLLWAATMGHEAVVKLLLDSDKVDADTKDEDGRTPLWYAVTNRHEAVVKLLLDSGKVDTDAEDIEYGRTLLWYAVTNRHEAVVKLLLDSGKVDANAKDKEGGTPLLYAATDGHEAIVKLLLDSGKVDVDVKDNKYGRTPLWCAATNGHEAVVKLLLDSGKVDVDGKVSKYDRTPLWCATTNGHEAVVKLLLDSGKVDTNAKDEYGRTVLLYAAANGNKAVVRLLLDTGKVDVDVKDSKYGRTPLSWAILEGHQAIVELLRGERESDGNLSP
jgi:ankyrin repeat protein